MLFYSIILTNPIFEGMSQPKLRRESNLKLVQRSPLRKKQGSAGAGYITHKCFREAIINSVCVCPVKII